VRIKSSNFTGIFVLNRIRLDERRSLTLDNEPKPPSRYATIW
jgi:hypothetical protein